MRGKWDKRHKDCQGGKGGKTRMRGEKGTIKAEGKTQEKEKRDENGDPRRARGEKCIRCKICERHPRKKRQQRWERRKRHQIDFKRGKRRRNSEGQRRRRHREQAQTELKRQVYMQNVRICKRGAGEERAVD
jgi:hypothetical protein